MDLCSGLKRKWTRVLWESEDSMRMSPPWPPSPPEGPPRGTNFSRRNAMQPFPPSPAFTRIRASSINILLLVYRTAPAAHRLHTSNQPSVNVTILSPDCQDGVTLYSQTPGNLTETHTKSEDSGRTIPTDPGNRPHQSF